MDVQNPAGLLQNQSLKYILLDELINRIPQNLYCDHNIYHMSVIP